MQNMVRVGVLTQADGPHWPEFFDALRQTEEVREIAIADPSGQCEPIARQLLGEKFSRSYPTHNLMLQEFRPLVGLVCMEARESPAAIEKALDAGCHVLTEKPACVDPADFKRLVGLADQRNLHLMLALANRPHAPVQEARRLVRAGLLGKIYGISMFLVADQARLQREDYRRMWRCVRARSGGGHLAWLGIHWLDLATYITGLRVQQVSAFIDVVGGQPIDVEDSAVLSLRYSDRVLGTMLSGFYLDLKHKDNVNKYHSHMRIWGEHGWLQLAIFEQEPLTWYSSLSSGPPREQTFEYPRGERTYVPFVRSAIRSAAGLEAPPITGREGLEVLQTIFAAYRAAETGRTQTVSG